MDAGSRRRALAGLVAALAAITILSQFLRTSGGVIAPELTAALDMTPEQLGAANGAFFLALGVMQLPVGILFDRFGPRRTVFWLNWVAVGGCVLHGIAGDAEQLIAARFLMGLGCGGNFMAAVLLYSRWHPLNQLAAKLSVMFALSQGGTLLAATPLALASGALGWRTTFLWVAALTALIEWWPQRRKRSLREGGVRVPGIVEWPAQLAPATVALTSFPHTS